MFSNLIMAFHNSQSRRAVRFFADTCVGLACSTIVYSKITAAAASQGIPDAQKVVLNAGKNLLFFADIHDAIETLNPQNVYCLVPRKYGSQAATECFTQIREELQTQKVLVMVGGTSPGLTRKEMDLGKCIFLEEVVTASINPIAMTSLFLSGLLRE